ncbi:Penicillin-binding protein 1A [Nitrosococcus oceani ATCC 19707]|uniref:Penicillin-binding protein 1A n=2 Tax=Nitrosococcus oceani TaxID=1229 RepID=Q3JEH0_NITOC|nr:penicillin-binding protein 1A [Nitrosococcus oceani]ABA56776.1 Penicillin-binding protein 1A [Nitrosococcus oceani ATCC 19707]EDZ65596.1 penicillin-binding protein, 1A family [Nitrosococcus oceani AFC27]KFI20729.1 peptidase [Nitrosococcus oceani C-27]
MTYLLRLFRWMVLLLLTATTVGILVAVGMYFYLLPQLPSTDTLKNIHLQVPLRIYSHDKKLIAQYGEKRRIPLAFEQFPDLLVKAILAAEDDRFYEHPGVDYQGILRAALYLVKTGKKAQGGSTITMQVARNFFLSREKTYLRKFNEILLALQIERELSKQDIIELYLNKIYLGNRAYGAAAAAQVYYGTTLDKLELSQLAMIAGLPKAPSRYNPIANQKRALLRRNYVLRRMREVGYIDPETYQDAAAQPATAKFHELPIELNAPFVAEMARSQMFEKYGSDIYTAGYNVYTTIKAEHQKAANDALRKALLDYDRRHGFRGPERHIELPVDAGEIFYQQALSQRRLANGLVPALVLATDERTSRIYTKTDGEAMLTWEGLSWAQPYLEVNAVGEKPKQAADILKAGDLIWVEALPKGGWRLAQRPRVEGAIVSLSPYNGNITALSGGFDFYESKFNRATQSQRQPGSSFKPFLYSAALNKGYTAASIINDAPIVLDEPGGPDNAWRPENYSGRFYGPTRLRTALTHSRNLVSIRLLRAIGIDYAIEYIQNFGFKAEQLPQSLSLALGSGSASPLEMARGFAVFANGGYLIEPYLIERTENADGKIIFRSRPAQVCQRCEKIKTERTQAYNPTLTADLLNTESAQFNPAPRAITAQNAYLINSMLHDVIRHGTGRRAKKLGRNDLAGKTGTTNDQHDAWFSGFNPELVAVCWVGFDQPESLGSLETGARVALPMWINYMGTVLDGTPEKPFIPPKGMVTVRIDPETGLLADSNASDAIFETFIAGHAPTRYDDSSSEGSDGSTKTDTPVAERLF